MFPPTVPVNEGLPTARHEQIMTKPDSTWPPPPTAPPPQQGNPKDYTWVGTTILVLSCYTVLWNCLFCAVAYVLRDGDAGFLIIFGWQVQMFAPLCLHLPILLLFQRFQRHRPKNVRALTSAAWGCVVAWLQWVINNYMMGGYDPACDPYTGLINWGCGISSHTIVSFSVAGSASGYLVGRILANRHTS